MLGDAPINNVSELLFADLEAYFIVKHMLGVASVNKAQILRNRLVVDDAANGRLNQLLLGNAVNSLGNSNSDGRVHTDSAVVISHKRFVGAGESTNRAELSLFKLAFAVGSLFTRSDSLNDALIGFDDVLSGNDGVFFKPRITGVNNTQHFDFILAHADKGQVVST